MKIIDSSASGRVYCPFCGKLAFDINQDEEVSQTCPHLLFNAFTGSGLVDIIREDIASEDGENFAPELLGIDPVSEAEEDEFDDDLALWEQIEKLDLPNSVCFEVSRSGSVHSTYVGFSQTEDFRKTSA